MFSNTSFPTSGYNEAVPGSKNWNISEQVISDNNIYATCVNNGSGLTSSSYLHADGFIMNVSDDYKIDAIIATVNKKSTKNTPTRNAVDTEMYLTKNGVFLGSSAPVSTGLWPVTEQSTTYAWGGLEHGITPADVRNGVLGCALRCKIAGITTVYVDVIKMYSMFSAIVPSGT